MKFVEFGESKTRVSEVVLGCMRIPQLEQQEVSQLLETAIDCDINMLDIADVYTNGKAEEMLGKALKDTGLRDRFFIQSKCGIRKNPHFFDFSKEHIVSAVEKSLQRIGTDHLDSLLLHRPDALMEPEEVGEAFNTLYKSGKVLNFGVSNMNRYQMELLSSGLDMPLTANQMQLSVCHTMMFDHSFNVNMDNDAAVMRDGGILEYCRLKNMAIQAWSVMQHGFFRGVFIGAPEYLKLNSVLDRIAEEQQVTSTAVAIAWILRYPGKMQAIIGTTNKRRVRESALASTVKLDRAQWYEIYLAAGNNLP
ncbi:MAG: aldo/keto reductase [Succinivibrio sp.]|nr:aldo/keto reductase [Succinivibrio sp.]